MVVGACGKASSHHVYTGSRELWPPPVAYIRQPGPLPKVSMSSQNTTGEQTLKMSPNISDSSSNILIAPKDSSFFFFLQQNASSLTPRTFNNIQKSKSGLSTKTPSSLSAVPCETECHRLLMCDVTQCTLYTKGKRGNREAGGLQPWRTPSTL